MSVAVATMGKFWPAFGTGSKVIVDDGGGSGIGTLYHEKKKPVVQVTSVRENGHTKRKLKIEVTSVTES